jgi:hypothetical protein
MSLLSQGQEKRVSAPRKTLPLKSPSALFWTGLVIRVLYIALAHSYRFKPIHDHFEFGWEMGRIARALATGYGYADPFVGHTGPTAWTPPLYPLLLAAVFKIFGVYTAFSGAIILTLNSIFSAATAPAVWEIGARSFDRQGYGKAVAPWAGWIWALFPGTMQYAVRWVWEMSLSTMLLAWVVVFALRLRGIGDSERVNSAQKRSLWAIFGLFWGLIALSNSTLLLFLPACGLWILAGSPRSLEAWRGAVLAGVVFLACLLPWGWRNWTAFHAFIPIRGNLGAELYLATGPYSNGFPWGTTLPLVEGDPEIQRYKEMGEVAFVKERGDLAKAYIRAHKKHFALLSLKRFYFFWVSVPHPDDKRAFLEDVRTWSFCFISLSGLLGLLLAIRRGVPGAILFAWAFALLPLTYYFVTAGARFRHPLEPLIATLAVYLFQSAELRRGCSDARCSTE